MSSKGTNRWRTRAAILLIASCGVMAFEPLRHSLLPAQACRFIETYHKAPELGLVGKLALGLMEAGRAAENDRT